MILINNYYKMLYNLLLIFIIICLVYKVYKINKILNKIVKEIRRTNRRKQEAIEEMNAKWVDVEFEPIPYHYH